jgi:hypothetical protein
VNQKLSGRLLKESGKEISGKIETQMPIEAYGRKIYLSSLVLGRHWGFELGTRGSRVWIQTRIPANCEEREQVLADSI